MNKSTKLLYLITALAFVAQCLKVLAPLPFLKNQLLANDSFAEWICIQVVPSMYNYSNLYWQSDFDFHELDYNDICRGDYEYIPGVQVNHYPLRLITFTHNRSAYFSAQPKSFIVKSSFRGRSLIRVYKGRLENNVLIVELKNNVLKN